MDRRQFALGLAALLAAPSPVRAEGIEESIVAQLQRQGYIQIEVTGTLLGRTRILAISPVHRREIILDPRTGEILRDYWERRDGLPEPPRIYETDDTGGSDGGGPRTDDDPDDDDDGPDDDDDDDDDDGDD